MKKVKLIWDFRGMEAKEIAQHHVKHLEEYSAAQNKPHQGLGIEEISEYYALAFMIVNEDEMLSFRDALRPHRAVYA